MALQMCTKCQAGKTNQLIVTQYVIVIIAHCLSAPKGISSNPSVYVTELNEKVNKITLKRIRYLYKYQ